MTHNWIIANLGALLLCFTFIAQITYSLNDEKLIRHRPEIHKTIDSDKTITLTTSKYIIGNAPVHIYCGDTLYATTWRDNTITVSIPDDISEVCLKNCGEKTMATIETSGPKTEMYMRSINIMPITWEVLDINNTDVDDSNEVEAYKKLCSEFRSANIWNLIMGFGPALALIISLISMLFFQ